MSFALGDMHVIGKPPAKLAKALAVIADKLHPAYDQLPGVVPGYSKQSCVLCSVVIRDFLKAIGFRRARLTTCYLVVRSTDKDGEEIHSVGVGDHNRIPAQLQKNGPVYDTPTKWSGHAVVEVDGWVIDASLYQAKRPAFGDMPGMVAVRGTDDTAPLFGMTPLAGLQARNEDDGSILSILWMRQSNDRWKGAPDATAQARLDILTKALADAFGHWRG